jgi:hypothetical protein
MSTAQPPALGSARDPSAIERLAESATHNHPSCSEADHLSPRIKSAGNLASTSRPEASLPSSVIANTLFDLRSAHAVTRSLSLPPATVEVRTAVRTGGKEAVRAQLATAERDEEADELGNDCSQLLAAPDEVALVVLPAGQRSVRTGEPCPPIQLDTAQVNSSTLEAAREAAARTQAELNKQLKLSAVRAGRSLPLTCVEHILPGLAWGTRQAASQVLLTRWRIRRLDKHGCRCKSPRLHDTRPAYWPRPPQTTEDDDVSAQQKRATISSSSPKEGATISAPTPTGS